MTDCARGCCWTGMQVCARTYSCACHWGDWLQTARATGGADRTYRDPTANTAIRNADRSRERRR